LKAHFTRSKIVPFEKPADAREALRTGAIDALFGDSVRLMFWVHGETSKGCCRLTNGAYRDKTYLDTPLAIAVRRDNSVLREVLDHGLDRLQTSGQFSRIYKTFFPERVW
jgi:polar amino acid transport system substrate-binding protein